MCLKFASYAIIPPVSFAEIRTALTELHSISITVTYVVMYSVDFSSIHHVAYTRPIYTEVFI